MGYLTVIVIRNDALHAFKEDPKLFGESILEGVDRANMEHKQISVPFKGFCNYIDVEPSRHADHQAIFLHSGNCLTVVGQREPDWENLVKRSPNVAAKFHKTAAQIVKWAKESFKKD